MSTSYPPENNPQHFGHDHPNEHHYSQGNGSQHPGQQGSYQQGGYPPPPEKKSSKALPVIIGVIVGVLAMLGIAWATGMFDSSDDAEPTTSETTSETSAEPTDETTTEETAEKTTSAPETTEAEETGSDGASDAGGQDDTVSNELRELVESQHRLEPNDPRALGPGDAPVVIEIYSDYRCGYCKMFHDEVFPDLQPQIEDGTLRVEYNSMPVLGPPSILAAQASHAAALQYKFWEFHDVAFAFDGEFTEDSLVELASGIEGLDIEQFTNDMMSPETVAYVESERQNGVEIGIQGTPSFMIGYSLVPGFVETPQFQSIIDFELDRQ